MFATNMLIWASYYLALNAWGDLRLNLWDDLSDAVKNVIVFVVSVIINVVCFIAPLLLCHFYLWPKFKISANFWGCMAVTLFLVTSYLAAKLLHVSLILSGFLTGRTIPWQKADVMLFVSILPLIGSFFFLVKDGLLKRA